MGSIYIYIYEQLIVVHILLLLYISRFSCLSRMNKMG